MNYDLCEACLSASGNSKDDFFFLENKIDTQAFHRWYKCKRLAMSAVEDVTGDGCGVEPLWGIRFHCMDCDDLDICEGWLVVLVDTQGIIFTSLL